MGIGFVLLAWGLIGVALAAIGTAMAAAKADKLCSGIADLKGKKQLATELKLVPIRFFVWLVAVFLFQTAVNIGLLHRDCGLGDGFDCTLSNGYALSGIDVTDHMRLYNPETLPKAWDSIDARSDAVDNVISLQIAGPYLAGASTKNPFDQHWSGAESLKADNYFILDTRAGTQKHYKSLEALQDATSSCGFKLKLAPISEIYHQNRFTVFDTFVLFLQLGLPAIYLCSLSRRIANLRYEQLALSLNKDSLRSN